MYQQGGQIRIDAVMTELHQPDGAKPLRVQLAREATQDFVRVLMRFVDECCEVALGVECHALIPEKQDRGGGAAAVKIMI
jgi:hypothetical protein